MAHHDNLTSLPNRVLFSQRINEALRADRQDRKFTATLCLDLDNFKNVNDALGHQIGDDLLRCADMALYEAKRNGRNSFEYFTELTAEMAAMRRMIENDLREAIGCRQLKLCYQPITNHLRKDIVGYEVLMR